MPSGNDNIGNPVYWIGGYDPHTAGAYLSASQASMGIWLSGDGTHAAVMNLNNVLAGASANPSTYAPLTTGDIAYIAMP